MLDFAVNGVLTGLKTSGTQRVSRECVSLASRPMVPPGAGKMQIDPTGGIRRGLGLNI